MKLNFKERKKQNKGITLIALIITIIILLILAGISISALNNQGLFGKAKDAEDRTIKAQLKEEIDLAIQEIQIEEIPKGNNVTLETLSNGQLQSKLTGITATLENNEITGEYKSYYYKIDSNLNVSIEGEVKGIRVSYTLNPEGYTKEDVKISITASSTNGKVADIKAPSELVKNEDGTYTVTKNGIYSFEIIDETNIAMKKNITINNIDKLSPEKCEVSINKNLGTRILVNVNAKDAEATQDNAQSGIEKYTYFIKKNSESVYKTYASTESTYMFKDLNEGTQYNIYVIAYDKAGNYKESSVLSETTKTATLSSAIATDKGIFNSINLETGEYYINSDIEMLSDKIPTALYDGTGTELSLKYSDVRELDIDESAIGKVFWVKGYLTAGIGNVLAFIDNNGAPSWNTWNEAVNVHIVEFVIPEGTKKIMLGNWQSNTTGIYMQIGIK